MNRDLSDLPGAGDQDDPVAEFFAAERADVRELPAGTDRWEGILTEARRPVRRRWMPYAAAAAAAVVVGGLVWGTVNRPSQDLPPATASGSRTVPTLDRSASVTSAATATSPLQGTVTSGTQAPSTPLPVPVSFGLVSLTNGGKGSLHALGTATCTGRPCVSVVGSDDDGRTWTSQASFTTMQATGAGRLTPEADDELVGLRFANAKIGYAYGAKTFRAANGHDFKEFDVGGRRVLSLEVGGGTAWMVTADACTHGAAAKDRGCTGLEVWSAPVEATRATKVRDVETKAPVDAAWLSMDGADAYLNVSSTDPSQQVLPQLVSGKGRTVTRPAGCAGTGGLWAWATADTRHGLVAVCRTDGDEDGSYSVATSKDAGATWTTAAVAKQLAAPGSAGVWLTAVDLTHLVAVRQGMPTSSSAASDPSAVLTSSDGGRSWATPKGLPDEQSWSWAGAAGGALVYAVNGGQSYWRSSDSGASFDEVPLRR